VQFLGEEITPSDAKNFFASISYDLWNGIPDNDDEEMMKEKVINFLNLFHVVKNSTVVLFEYQVTKDQSSVTEAMQVCLPTTCKLLGIPRRIGQVVKAALLCKEEAATMVLSTVAERKYPSSNFYCHFSNNLIVPVMPTSAKARRIVKALEGHIITLSEGSLIAVDDIGQHHFPKQVQSFLQACLHGMV